MIKKAQKQLHLRNYHEPEAVKTLRTISEDAFSSGKINTYKFPFTTIHNPNQEEEIADWGKEDSQFLTRLNQETKGTKLKFKTIFNEQKEIKKNQRYKIQLTTLTNKSFKQDVLADQFQHDEQVSQQKQRPRCARKNIDPQFQNNNKQQRPLNTTKISSSHYKYLKAQSKGLAIKKIKKELMHNLDTRSKLPIFSQKLENVSSHRKSRLCSEIHLRLNIEPEVNTKKESTPKHIRLTSRQSYVISRSSTVVRCFDQQRDNSFIRLKTDDSLEYKLLKKLLNRERN